MDSAAPAGSRVEPLGAGHVQRHLITHSLNRSVCPCRASANNGPRDAFCACFVSGHDDF